MREAVVDEGDPRRIQGTPGPFLFLNDGKAKRLVINMSDGLLNDDPEVRKASVRHFQHLAGLRGLLTPKSADLLNKQSRDAISQNSKKWYRTAMEIFDALQNDFLCCLAGFRQCLELDFREGIDQSVEALFFPSLSSMDSITEPVCSVSNHADDARKPFGAILKSASSLREAATRYFECFGHIPLAGDLSLGRLVQDWIADHHDESAVWETVWAWVGECHSPYARYHACQAFANNPTLVPREMWAGFWANSLEVMTVFRPNDNETPHQEAWRLRCDLARHFCRHLECCRRADHASETLAAFSWWMADQVSSVFGFDDAYLSSIRKGPAASFGMKSDKLWHLVHPWAAPSDLRYATLNVRSLWGTALAAQLAPALDASPFAEIDDELIDGVTKALIGNVVSYGCRSNCTAVFESCDLGKLLDFGPGRVPSVGLYVGS
jgi:hypothetical protein